ncbi:MAG TPA: hypothetical protein VFD49_09180 [Candidatus Dormibacteraeota bacterium]|nr:hypothetical protein [Candidatus Dormibacteraeota bacterium]
MAARVWSSAWDSVWTVIVLAILLGAIAAIRGYFRGATLLSLIVLVLVGALWPPLGIVIGGVALVWTALTQTVPLLQQLRLLGGQP